jgi:invasion protein IalB
MKFTTIALTLLGSLLSSATWAQAERAAPAEKPKIEKFDNWSKVCFAVPKNAPKGTKPKCHLEQAFAAPQSDNKQPIFIWRVSVNDKKEVLGLAITPNNVLLGRGVQFEMAADKSTVVPYFTCRPGFCELRFRLEADLVKTLGAKETVPVNFTMVNNDQVAIAVPMKGFAKGVESLLK